MLFYQISWAPRDVCCLPRLVLTKQRNPRWVGIIVLDIKCAHCIYEGCLSLVALLADGFLLSGQLAHISQNFLESARGKG